MKARVGKKREGRKSPWPVRWYPPGKAVVTRWFETRSKAVGFAREKNTELVNEGFEAPPTAEELRAFRAWREAQAARAVAPAWAELVEDYLLHLEINSGYRWHKDNRITLNRLTASRAAWRLADFDTPAIQGWLDSLPVGPTTKRNYWSHLHAFGQWLVERRGMLEQNPVGRVFRPKPPPARVRIFTVEEIKKYLEWIRANDPAFLPCQVVQFFAGLRVETAVRLFRERLDRPPLNWERLAVDIPGELMKRRRRLYSEQFPAVLWRWLEGYHEPGGWIRGESQGHRRRRDRAVAGSGIDWKPNGPRYSFASYHLAATQDPGKTALLLAHRRGIQLLLDRYDGHATQAEAKAFMNLTMNKQ